MALNRATFNPLRGLDFVSGELKQLFTPSTSVWDQSFIRRKGRGSVDLEGFEEWKILGSESLLAYGEGTFWPWVWSFEEDLEGWNSLSVEAFGMSAMQGRRCGKYPPYVQRLCSVVWISMGFETLGPTGRELKAPNSTEFVIFCAILVDSIWNLRNAIFHESRGVWLEWKPSDCCKESERNDGHDKDEESNM